MNPVWTLIRSLVLVFALSFAAGCQSANPPVPAATPTAQATHCDAKQARISSDADTRARSQSRTGRGFQEHVATNFADHKVAWLMREDLFQKYVIETKAKSFGRCESGACYLFVAPVGTIRKAVADSMKDGKHDPVMLGTALGLPPKSFEGPLRMMTLDLDATPVCARLPVDEDPGVWKCKGPEDKDCFFFGGYTSGGIPEAMIIDAPVAGTKLEAIP